MKQKILFWLLVIALFALISFGCNTECKIVDKSFRPHKVRHCNKSKQYWYYHNEPCDCNGIQNDLHHSYQQTYDNYIIFYDNGDIIKE